MGMDIVRRTVVDQLGGHLSVRSEPGLGTTFVLRVPLTISIVDAFTFECAEQRFAVPLSTIEEILDLEGATIGGTPMRRRSDAGSVGVIQRRGGAVSVLRLDVILGLPAPAVPAARPKGLVVRSDGDAVAFVVDRMLGQQEIVVRALEDPLVHVTGISGATDLGDGRPTLIVDLAALSARNLGQQRTANGLASPGPRGGASA
jgi:two-component system chemotaxis sensor kinase CheA